MLHTKFYLNQTDSSVEEDGLIALMPPTKFGVDRPSTFGGEDVFVNC